MSDGCRQENGQPYSTTTPNGCLGCPTTGCVELVEPNAVADNGIVEVHIRCLLRVACNGALLLLQPERFVGSDGNKAPPSEWIGGSDITVPAESTASVPVALTSTGQSLITGASNYGALVQVQLHTYGTAMWGNDKLVIQG